MRKALPTGLAAALILAISLAALPAAAQTAPNADFAKARAQAAKLADSLQSYEIKADLSMEQKPVGAPEGMKFEATQHTAGRMPDRLLVNIESPMFQQTWGTGGAGSWFYFAQQQACYVGGPVTLTRILESEQAQGLDPDQIYNFYAGVGEHILTSEVEVAAETGQETLTVNGAEVPCQVFKFKVVDEASGQENGHGSYWFDPRSGLVIKSSVTTLNEQNGMEMEGTMTSAITSFTLNGKPAEELFTYTPVAGTRVVDSFDRLLNPDSMVGEMAPEIAFTTFSGETVNLSDYRGKVVFLDFWATWCGPCRMEMPHIQTLHDEMQASGEVVFLGASNEDQKTIQGWLEKNPYTFKIVMVKPEDAQTKFKVSSIPAGFVIDRQGKIAAHMIGAQSEKQLREALKKGGVE